MNECTVCSDYSCEQCRHEAANTAAAGQHASHESDGARDIDALGVAVGAFESMTERGRAAALVYLCSRYKLGVR